MLVALVEIGLVLQGTYILRSRSFLSSGISSLRNRYRYPTDLNDCVIDVIAGVTFLAYGYVTLCSDFPREIESLGYPFKCLIIYGMIEITKQLVAFAR